MDSDTILEDEHMNMYIDTEDEETNITIARNFNFLFRVKLNI